MTTEIAGLEVPEGTRDVLVRLKNASSGSAAVALYVIRQVQDEYPLTEKAKLMRRLAQRVKASEVVSNG